MGGESYPKTLNGDLVCLTISAQKMTVASSTKQPTLDETTLKKRMIEIFCDKNLRCANKYKKNILIFLH